MSNNKVWRRSSVGVVGICLGVLGRLYRDCLVLLLRLVISSTCRRSVPVQWWPQTSQKITTGNVPNEREWHPMHPKVPSPAFCGCDTSVWHLCLRGLGRCTASREATLANSSRNPSASACSKAGSCFFRSRAPLASPAPRPPRSQLPPCAGESRDDEPRTGTSGPTTIEPRRYPEKSRTGSQEKRATMDPHPHP